MDIHVLIAKLKGEFLANKVFANHGGKRVKIGIFQGTELVFTPEGSAIADALSNEPSLADKTAAIKAAAAKAAAGKANKAAAAKTAKTAKAAADKAAKTEPSPVEAPPAQTPAGDVDLFGGALSE